MPLLSLMLTVTVSKVTTIFIRNRVIQMLVAYPLCVCVYVYVSERRLWAHMAKLSLISASYLRVPIPLFHHL